MAQPITSIEGLLRLYRQGQRDFSDTDIEEGHFKHLDFEGASFRGAWLHSSTFEQCNLKEVDFSGGNIKSSHFSNCDLSNASFDETLLCGSSFEYCNLTNVSFDQAGWYGVDLETTSFLATLKNNNRIA